MENSSKPTKADALKARLEGLLTFLDVQKELALIIASLERQAEVLKVVRADRNMAKAQHENNVATKIVSISESVDKPMLVIEAMADKESYDTKAALLEAERKLDSEDMRYEVMREYLRSIEILSNNMRAEMRMKSYQENAR